MRTIINLCFLTSLCALSAFAQEKVRITKPVPVISYEPAFFLEQGVSNVLHFDVGDTSVTRILVNANQGTVKQEGNDFVVVPETEGEIVFSIYNYNDISNPVLIEERKMTVRKKGPVPAVLIAGKNGGEITVKEIVEAGKLDLQNGGPMKIKEYKFSVAGKSIQYREFQGRDEYLTAEMIECLQKLNGPAKVFVEFIRAGTSQAMTRQIAPVTFLIK